MCVSLMFRFTSLLLLLRGILCNLCITCSNNSCTVISQYGSWFHWKNEAHSACGRIEFPLGGISKCSHYGSIRMHVADGNPAGLPNYQQFIFTSNGGSLSQYLSNIPHISVSGACCWDGRRCGVRLASNVGHLQVAVATVKRWFDGSFVAISAICRCNCSGAQPTLPPTLSLGSWRLHGNARMRRRHCWVTSVMRRIAAAFGGTVAAVG